MRRLCEGLPGVRGATKVIPEDFEVEELPAYEPSGEGDHLFLWVEKRGRNTQDVVRELAAALGLRERDIGVAGQKDRQAITRQYLSVPASSGGEGARGDGWRVLEARRHRNKLRVGHLRGNRFRIRLRGAGEHEGAAERSLDRLTQDGLPNYFGPQRFGRAGDNAERGRALLEGTLQIRGRFERRMLVSALQSALFNDWLDARIDDGLFDQAIAGDLLQKRESGGVFACVDPQTDTARMQAGELDALGPMFGRKLRPVTADAARREAQVLERAGIETALFASAGRDGQGARRPARVPLAHARVEVDGDDLVVGFELPRGAYATVVLGELSG